MCITEMAQDDNFTTDDAYSDDGRFCNWEYTAESSDTNFIS
jgi:hypothetical protein